jgi:hypothetical protein
VTSALLLVALLALVDLSYRRWMRRSIAKRMHSAADLATVDLDEREAAIIPMPARGQRTRDDVEVSRRRDERQSS